MNIIQYNGTNNLNSTSSREIKYIVIHYTAGESSASGNAKIIAGFFQSGKIALKQKDGSVKMIDTVGSADFIVDDSTFIQYNPDIKTKYCNAVGSQQGKLNTQYAGAASLYDIAKNINCVSIEVCSTNKLGYYTDDLSAYSFTSAVINNAVELTKYLMSQYNVPASNVIRHFDVCGKICPGVQNWTTYNNGTESEWANFKSRIGGSYSGNATNSNLNSGTIATELKLGHARSEGEGLEISNWYDKGWHYVLRHSDSSIARKSAEQCVAGCNNKVISYSQGSRNTIATQAEANGWDISKITSTCYADCSSFMSTCAACGGVSGLRDFISKNGGCPSTENMRSIFTQYGYTALNNSSGVDYLKSKDNLIVGDILLKEGSHAAMVVESNGTGGAGGGTGGVSGFTSNAGVSTQQSYMKVETEAYFAEDWTDTSSGVVASFDYENTKRKNFDRQYRLSVGVPGEEGFEIGLKDIHHPRPLHVSFSIQKKAVTSLNTCNIDIWNLNEEQLAILENVNVTYAQLRAGYGEDLRTIFNGEIKFCTTVKEGADWKTSLEILDGYISIIDTHITCAFNGGTSWDDILKDVCKQAGVMYVLSENVDLSNTTNGFSFSGNCKEAMTKICESNNTTWSLQNGIIQVKNKGEAMTSSICHLISSKTGMIGSPQMVREADTDWSTSSYNEFGIAFDVNFLMNAAIDINDFVRLESKMYTGYFTITDLTINGDNESGSWSCKARMTPAIEGGANQLQLFNLMNDDYYISNQGLTKGAPVGSSGGSSGYSSGNFSNGGQNTATKDGLSYFEHRLVDIDDSMKHYDDAWIKMAAESVYSECGAAEESITFYACAFWTHCNGLISDGVHNCKGLVANGVASKNHFNNSRYYYKPSTIPAKCKHDDGSIWTYKQNINLTELAYDVYNRWSLEEEGKSASEVGRVLPYKNELATNIGIPDVFIYYVSEWGSSGHHIAHRKLNRSYYKSTVGVGKGATGYSQYWYFQLGSPYEAPQYYDLSIWWDDVQAVKDLVNQEQGKNVF